MKKLLVILGLMFVVTEANAQVINFVEHEYQADFKVFFNRYEWGSDVTIYYTDRHYEAKAGWWYWDSKKKYYGKDKVNVYVVQYPFQADYKVYITENKWEVKVTDKYINEWIKNF